MRRRMLVALASASVLIGCSPAPDPGQPGHLEVTPSVAPSTPAQPLCVDLVRAMGRDDRIAQLFMLGVDVADGSISARTSNLLADTGAGSVLLLGNSDEGVAGISELTRRLRSGSRQPGGVELLVAADQEGGRVQRLTGDGFAEMPSASAQAALSDDELRSSARGWGESLKQAGVDYNLAPVADVVPAADKDRNTPIGALEREFGSDPVVVKRKAQAFVDGMSEARVATSLKHFPGLGRVQGNTDVQAEVTDDETTAEDVQSFVGYQNLDSVMISSATYTELDPNRPAVYSRKIITGLLRVQHGWSGVVISDDLGVAKSAAAKPEIERGASFLAAGGDLVIDADPETLAAMIEGVRRRADEDEGFESQLPDKAARVLEMKAKVGRANCRPGRPEPTAPGS